MNRLGLVLVVAALATLVAAPALSTPPKAKYYAGYLVVVDPDTGEIDAAPACLSFSKSEMCNEAGDCGRWEFVAKRGHQNEWRGTLDFTDGDGTVVRTEIRGITERLGPGSSIAGTVVAEFDGIVLNAAFGGVKVSRAACLELGLSDDQ